MYSILLTAFPMSEKELSGLVIVKEGHRILPLLGGVVDCILLRLSSLEIFRVILADSWCIDVTVNYN